MSWFARDSPLVKIGVIALVLAFLLEIFAFQSAPPVGVDDNTQTTTQQAILGIANANATVTSYSGALGPSVSVIGQHPELQDKVDKLKKQGLVDYTSPLQNGIVLNLGRDANISQVVQELSSLNLTLFASAELTFSEPIKFATQSGTLDIPVQRIKLDLDPAIPVGYTVGLRITASLYDGKIVEGKYDIVPINVRFLLRGEIIELFPEHTAIGVLSWGDRDFDPNKTEEYISNRYGDVNLYRILNSTVIFSKQLSEEQVSDIREENFSYVVEVGDMGLAINESFTNSSILESDLSPYLEAENITMGYPLSYLRVDFKTDDFSEEFFNASLENAVFFYYRNMTIRINEKVYDPLGNSFRVLGRDHTNLLEYTNETGGKIIVTADARVVGDMIYNYTIVE